MNEKERTLVGSFKEAAPIVSWKNSFFNIQPSFDGREVELYIGLYDHNDNPIDIGEEFNVFNFLPLPTWQDQLKALGFIRRVAQRIQNERHRR